jgi:upstream activation factor subunit UAF30
MAGPEEAGDGKGAMTIPAGMPDHSVLKSAIYELVRKVDLETTGLKKFTRMLARHVGMGEGGAAALSTSHSTYEFIKQTLTEAIQQIDDEEQEGDEDDDASDQDDDEENDDDDDDDDDDDVSKSKKSRGVGKRGGGLAEPKPISKELADFLLGPGGGGGGKNQEKDQPPMMSRSEIVKRMWEYVRENDLQNPQNKREILLDDSMKEVFKCDTFTMFTMNKYIGAHIHPFKPVDLSGPSPNTAGKKRRASASSGSGKKKGKGGGVGSKKKKPRKTGSQPPYRLSEELQDVVGTDVLPRPQVVSKMWEYIKAHNLQNPTDKREILCDEKLRKIFQNKSRVTMFSMNQYITDHLLEKVDRTEYSAAATAAATAGDGSDYEDQEEEHDSGEECSE